MAHPTYGHCDRCGACLKLYTRKGETVRRVPRHGERELRMEHNDGAQWPACAGSNQPANAGDQIE